MLCASVQCVGCAGTFVPIRGGGVAVGWYPVWMWLFVGLGTLLCCLLHTFMSWLWDLQSVQKTLSLQSDLTWPCSPHLKHVGPFLVSEEFAELSWKPLRLIGLVVHPCVVIYKAAFVLFLCLNRSLWSVVLLALVVNWPVRADPAPWSIESFTSGSYLSPLLVILAVK